MFTVSSSVSGTFCIKLCIVPTIILWNNIYLIREYSALQEVINKFSYVFLPEHVDTCATCARSILMSSISSHFEHICWEHTLFGTTRKISVTLFRTLRALCIKKTYINLFESWPGLSGATLQRRIVDCLLLQILQKVSRNLSLESEATKNCNFCTLVSTHTPSCSYFHW